MARERGERGSDQGAASSQAPLNETLSVAEIRQLVSLMDGSDIEEIAIEQESQGLKLALRKPAPVAVASLFDEEDDADDLQAATAEPEPRGTAVKAQFVGVFRASMRREGKPLIGLGDAVREGQLVGAIEALNVLNEVEAPAAGRVSELLVMDGQAVEYGQPLLVIEP